MVRGQSPPEKMWKTKFLLSSSLTLSQPHRWKTGRHRLSFRQRSVNIQRRRAICRPPLRRCLLFAVRGTVILMFRETHFPLNKSRFFPSASLCSFFYFSVFFLDCDVSPVSVLLPLKTAVLCFSYPPVATFQSTFSTFPMIFSSKMGKMASSSRTSSNTTPQSNSSLTFLK